METAATFGVFLCVDGLTEEEEHTQVFMSAKCRQKTTQRILQTNLKVQEMLTVPNETTKTVFNDWIKNPIMAELNAGGVL